MSDYLLFDIEPEFSYSIDDQRRHVHQLNVVTRSAVLTVFHRMDEPLKSIYAYHAHFRMWVSRTAWSNFIHGRKRISSDRCLGILYTLSALENKQWHSTLTLSHGDTECLLTERRLCLLRLLTMEWLCGTLSAEMLLAHPPLYGQICSVLNSSESSPIVSQLEKETSEPGLPTTKDRPRSSAMTWTLKHSSQESF